jgi:hypothetical protein
VSSSLPSGPPAGKGRTLDPSLRSPLQTFSKPEEDIRELDLDDRSIHNVDGPYDLGKKDQALPDQRVVEENPSYTAPGVSVSPKTKAPYRDDRPNSKMADRVAERYMKRNQP